MISKKEIDRIIKLVTEIVAIEQNFELHIMVDTENLQEFLVNQDNYQNMKVVKKQKKEFLEIEYLYANIYYTANIPIDEIIQICLNLNIRYLDE